MKRTKNTTANDSDNSEDDPKSPPNLKYLSPLQEEWLDLFPVIDENDDDLEIRKRRANEAKETIRETLLAALQMPNLLVLAGSGTSLGDIIGGPSMWDLWDYAMHKNPPTAVDGTPTLKEESEAVIEKVGYNLEIQGQNIESFLSRCEAYLEVYTDKSVRDFVDDCKRITLEKCSCFLMDSTSGEWDDKKLDGHGIFLHRLSRRRVRDPRLKIFTTNYDLCFERAAALKGLIVIDGFSFTQPRRFGPSYFEYDIVRRSTVSNEVGDPLEGVFHLLKLHGSVNWERDNNGGICEKISPNPAKACLIYPESGKYQQTYLQPHLELMAQYLASLRQPNTCLIVTGFGFNDDHLAEPILSAITSNSQLRVIIADYKAEDNLAGRAENASKYWGQLLELSRSGENIWFINASFGEFANLLPDLKALTPAQQLEKTIKRIGTRS